MKEFQRPVGYAGFEENVPQWVWKLYHIVDWTALN